MYNGLLIRWRPRLIFLQKFGFRRETLLLAGCLIALDVGCAQQPPSTDVSQPVVSSDQEVEAAAENNREFTSSDEEPQNSPATNVYETARTGAKSAANADHEDSASAVPQPRTDYDAEIAGSSNEGSEGDNLPSNLPDKQTTVRQKKVKVDLEAVRKNAKAFHKQARSAMSSGDDGIAFRFAAKAWQATQTAPDDGQLKALATEIRADLELISARANAKFAAKAANPSTLTIEK